MSSPNSIDELAIKSPVMSANIKHHVFVCTGTSCGNNESQATLEAFWKVLAEKELLYGKRGSLDGTVLVTTCGSMGFCTIGPAVMIYPEGVWYHHVQADDVTALVESHFIKGTPYTPLLGRVLGE